MAESKDRLRESVSRYNLDPWALRMWFRHFKSDLLSLAGYTLRINGFGTFVKRHQGERLRITRDNVLRLYPARDVVALRPPTRESDLNLDVTGVVIWLPVEFHNLRSVGPTEAVVNLGISISHEVAGRIELTGSRSNILDVRRNSGGDFVIEMEYSFSTDGSTRRINVHVSPRSGETGRYSVENIQTTRPEQEGWATAGQQGNVAFVTVPIEVQGAYFRFESSRVLRAIGSRIMADAVETWNAEPPEPPVLV